MNATLEQIPEKISDTELLEYMRNKEINSEYVKLIKEYTQLPDQILSHWLNINIKTFRSYKQPVTDLKENLKEQIILLLSLFKHGEEVFGSVEDFNQWLTQHNFFMDDRAPIHFLNTISGIRFIDDRLTAMEMGDNV